MVTPQKFWTKHFVHKSSRDIELLLKNWANVGISTILPEFHGNYLSTEHSRAIFVSMSEENCPIFRTANSFTLTGTSCINIATILRLSENSSDQPAVVIDFVLKVGYLFSQCYLPHKMQMRTLPICITHINLQCEISTLC